MAPPHMSGGVYDFFNSTPGDNPTTYEGTTLGRVLFYDKQLSANKTTACASCHLQEHAFSDPNQFSEGFYGELTGRNSMAIVNPFMGFRYFWDIRANGLENQSIMPALHPVEMDMDSVSLVAVVNEMPYYANLFQDAFGDSTITIERIGKALSQFMRSIYSVNSKFDIGQQSSFSNFTAQELMGKDLFFADSRTNCNNCHQTYYFFDPSAQNNGSSSDYLNDGGVYDLFPSPNNFGDFKTPTLRNIEYSAPYFHYGRFATLE